MDPLGPQKYASYDNWDEDTARARSPQMVPHVKSIVEGAASRRKLTAAGYFERSAAIESIFSKKGNFGYQRGTDARLATTMRNAQGTSSGWAGQPAVRIWRDQRSRYWRTCNREMPAMESRSALTQASTQWCWSRPRSAIWSRFLDCDFRLAPPSRASPFSKKGGGTQFGKKLFPEIITLRTDPFDRRYPRPLVNSEACQPSRRHGSKRELSTM